MVEFGNAHHQPMVDADLAGHDVPARECHDFVGAAPVGFRAAIYPRLFATVRAVNATLPVTASCSVPHKARDAARVACYGGFVLPQRLTTTTTNRIRGFAVVR